MVERTFSVVFDELQAAHLAAAVDDIRYVTAVERSRALTHSIVESASRASRRKPDRSQHLSRARSAYRHGAAAQYNDAAGQSLSICMTLAELMRGLKGSPGVAKLRALRRRFAMGRHPDRVENADREQATADMQTANDLIDKALRQCKSQKEPN